MFVSVIILLADGARPDALARAMDDGSLPSLARLRAEGSYATVTTAFPSVTGPAYAPFLLGRYPGPVGLPGLRWFDRSRETARGFGSSRSYVGVEMRHIDADLDARAPGFLVERGWLFGGRRSSRTRRTADRPPILQFDVGGRPMTNVVELLRR